MNTFMVNVKYLVYEQNKTKHHILQNTGYYQEHQKNVLCNI